MAPSLPHWFNFSSQCGLTQFIWTNSFCQTRCHVTDHPIKGMTLVQGPTKPKRRFQEEVKEDAEGIVWSSSGGTDPSEGCPVH